MVRVFQFHDHSATTRPIQHNVAWKGWTVRISDRFRLMSPWYRRWGAQEKNQDHYLLRADTRPSGARCGSQILISTQGRDSLDVKSVSLWRPAPSILEAFRFGTSAPLEPSRCSNRAIIARDRMTTWWLMVDIQDQMGSTNLAITMRGPKDAESH